MDPRERDLLSAQAKRNGRYALADLRLTLKICDGRAPASLRDGWQPGHYEIAIGKRAGAGKSTRPLCAAPSGRIWTRPTFPRTSWNAGGLVDRLIRHMSSRVPCQPTPPHPHGFPRTTLTPGRWGNDGSVRKSTTDIPDHWAYPSGNMSSIGCGLSWQVIWWMHGRISLGWMGSRPTRESDRDIYN